MITLLSPAETALKIAGNFRRMRRDKRMTMTELSRRSGVSYASVKRFEHTGEVSFISLIKMAYVLDAQNELQCLFSESSPSSIEDIINGKY